MDPHLGTVNPVFTGTVTGARPAIRHEAFTTTATSLSNVGTYPIVPSVTEATCLLHPDGDQRIA